MKLLEMAKMWKKKQEEPEEQDDEQAATTPAQAPAAENEQATE